MNKLTPVKNMRRKNNKKLSEGIIIRAWHALNKCLSEETDLKSLAVIVSLIYKLKVIDMKNCELSMKEANYNKQNEPAPPEQMKQGLTEEELRDIERQLKLL